MKIILTSIFLPILVFSAPELRSKKALKTEIKAQTFKANLENGYHFNEKAPNGIQIEKQFLKPSSFSARQLEVQNLPKTLKGAVANLYVCDDKVTFCEVHMINLDGETSKVTAAPLKKATLTRTNKHGFFENYEAALKLAKNMKQILLVDFGARWCPPCLRLENEIFDSSEFKSLTKDFVKVKVDVDQFHNSPIMQKHSISGYPTILFLTPQEQEIVRFVDFLPLAEIQNVIADIKKNPISISDLEKKPDSPELQTILWRRYFQAGQFEKALPIMEKMNPKPKEYLSARIENAKSKKSESAQNKEAYIKILREALSQEPNGTRSLHWRSQLISELPKGHKDVRKLAQEANDLTQKWLTQPEELKNALVTDSLGEFVGLDGFYITFMNAAVAENADLNPKKAWEKVVEQGQAYKLTALQQGPALRFLTAMIKSEKYPEALEFVRSMLKADPQNGDLLRRELRVLLELKKYDEAVISGEKALKSSYGINEFFVVEPLAKTYLGLKQNEKAKKLLSDYLSRNEINFPDMDSIKKSLEELNSKL